MKSSYLRTGAALACALALSACGGSDGQLVLGGTIYNVTKTGLVLTNNGGSDFAVPVGSGSGTFNYSFPNLIETDDRYNVEVKAEPSNVKPGSCKVTNGSGRAGYHIYNVYVTCEFKTHPLGGSLSNLKGTLVLVNGSDQKEFQAGATSFAMSEIPEDSPYGVQVLRQPEGQTCTVSNGSGTMTASGTTNIAITCTP